MSLKIRERCQKIANYPKINGKAMIAAKGRATGLSHSSVYRHQQAMERRNQYPELSWWETQIGSAYLIVV